jgi:hypothetical protein
MCRGFIIPSEGFDMPWVGLRYTMGRGFHISWIGDSIYHGYWGQNIMGRDFDIS